MSKSKTKKQDPKTPQEATPQEHAVYLNYVKLAQEHKLTPRSEADWLMTYRERQARIQGK